MTQHSVTADTVRRSHWEATPTMQREPQPVDFWIATIWFGLCALQVHKNNDLIGIFFSFVGSFGLAFLLSRVLPPPPPPPPPPRHNNNTKNTFQSTYAYSRAKDVVGLIACIVSSVFSGLGDQFHAITVAAGYLTFDLWFSSVYCRKIPPPILSILEDALTLTLYLVALALYRKFKRIKIGFGYGYFTRRLYLLLV
jgi:hypothetical protein